MASDERHARLSVAGYRILAVLRPSGIGFDAQQVSRDRVEVSWTPAGDGFMVTQAKSAPYTGFPKRDAVAILRATGRSRTRQGSDRRRGPLTEAQELARRKHQAAKQHRDGMGRFGR